MRRHAGWSAGILAGMLALPGAGTSALAEPGYAFTAFESGPVRPLALSPDGGKLFAVNTPDNRLEIFDLTAAGPVHRGSVPVGLEPVAVAARTATEVWVVNHHSDSVSIVSLASEPPRVVRTLFVGDEPRDIVFAGPGRRRAFITAARRGQNITLGTKFFNPGIGRATVWVFDALSFGGRLGGRPIAVLQLFGDTPRALATSPDATRVYAAAFLSGNRTTAVHEQAVPNGTLPPPSTNAGGVPGPEVGLVVRHDGTHWVDEMSRTWDDEVRFSLPDKDIFIIDAMADPPLGIRTVRGVGTVLFNIAVNPVSGTLYVSNTEARNHVRFEGAGTFAGSTVRGHVSESRITVVKGGQVLPRHLNKHVDYRVTPGPAGEIARSLALPLGMAVTSDGSTLYVAAFGSGKIGVFSTAELEADTFTPALDRQIEVDGGGPAGVVLDEPRGRLYVLTRFDNALSVVELASRREVQHLPLFNPEPASVRAGRRFLYDARATSGHGDAACASCHVFGDLDALAWDLGDPDAAVTPNPNPFRVGVGIDPAFHPMKGPMTTQTLRGMAGHGPMHWRGDRTAGSDPGGDPLDEAGAFKKFNAAFDALLGRGTPLTAQEMQSFADFALQIAHPPNPVRNLDNSLTPSQQRGREFFLTGPARGTASCETCHRLDPQAGFFGTDGLSSFAAETQLFKIPHLRNLYAKVGMFGMPAVASIPSATATFQGDQIRGFGYMHDGSVDGLDNFLRAVVFNFPGGDPQRRDVAHFLLAFDNALAPIVGQQVTLASSNAVVTGPRIDLMVQRAAAGECDLVVKGRAGGQSRGWFRTATGEFRSDRQAESLLQDAQLRALAATAGQELTYTCAPPGSGVRIGVDRDSDGHFDRDEIDSGSDPADPASVPASASPTLSSRTASPAPGRQKLRP